MHFGLLECQRMFEIDWLFGGSASLNLPDRLRLGCKQRKWLTFVLIDPMLFSPLVECVLWSCVYLEVVRGHRLVRSQLMDVKWI